MIQPSTRGPKQENFAEGQHAHPAVLDREVARRELLPMPGEPLTERGERHEVTRCARQVFGVPAALRAG